MDRDEALKLLTSGEEGIRAWKAHRKGGGEIPSLASANLAGANLKGAYLKEAYLIRTDLTEANLTRAYLEEAFLEEANLTRAYLTRAYLEGANLTETNLEGANLAEANLEGARLTKARLTGANLTGVDFARADLTGANLTRTNLTGANLTRTRLTGTNLTGANLTRTNLTETDLTGANLTETDLTKARLTKARLTGANLTRTNLTRAICNFTTFGNLDLSQTRGLDEVVHLSPSTVGVDTLFRSKGQIPEVFLRSCGVPDALINYLPSLIGSMAPIQFYSCFISHSSNDAEFATRLHSRMTQEKLRVWYAPEDMKGGLKIVDQIDQAIRVHDKLLLVLSEASMNSDWVRHEVIRAVEREKAEGRQILFPIALVGHEAIRKWTAFDADLGRDLARVVREYHIPDFSKWKDHDAFEGSFARLLADLKSRDVPRPA